MEYTLEMRLEASYTLNFLIYIQNIYANQKQSGEEYKYPYMPIVYRFREDFEVRYSELWDKVSKRIAKNFRDDLTIFYHEKELFYENLFIGSDATGEEFHQIYQCYLAWWNSFAGRFSIERAFDEQVQNIYYDLSDVLAEKRIIPEKQLEISLIYDDCLLADSDSSSYFAVISIRDCYVKYKEIIQKLVICID